MPSNIIDEIALQLTGKKDIQTNSNWNVVPENWVCPCCKRSKIHLLKVSAAENLVGNLVNHHDHIQKYVENFSRELVSQNHNRRINEREGWFLNHKILPFLNRFERTLVCDDCNNADTVAKSLQSDVCKYFSFSPMDIAYFIEPKPHAKHEVNIERVNEIYPTLAQTHRYRKSLCDTLVSRLILNQRQWGDVTQYPEINHYKTANSLLNHKNRIDTATLLSLKALPTSQIANFSKALERIENKKHQKATKSDEEKLSRREKRKLRRELTRQKAIDQNLFNHGEPWDNENLKSLDEDHLSGMTLEELGVKNGRTVGAIKSRLRKRGFDV